MKYACSNFITIETHFWCFFEKRSFCYKTCKELAMTPADLIISLYVCVHIKKYPENSTFSILKVFELFNRNFCQMFVYKHTEQVICLYESEQIVGF